MSVLTYVEELERKTVGFCEDAALRHEQGVYTDRELKLVMNAVWQVTSGLVDQMTDIHDHVVGMGLKEEPVRRVAIKTGAAPLLIERQGVQVSVRKDPNWFADGGAIFDTEVDAVNHSKKIEALLEGKGYTII